MCMSLNNNPATAGPQKAAGGIGAPNVGKNMLTMGMSMPSMGASLLGGQKNLADFADPTSANFKGVRRSSILGGATNVR